MNEERMLLELEMNGWTVIEDVIPGTEVEQVRDRVLAEVQQHGSEGPAQKGIGHVSGLVARDPSFAGYLADDRVLGFVGGVLGHHIRVSFTSATINMPGNQRGGWHADWPFNQNNAGHVPTPYPDEVFHLTSIWMLVPFTSENGGTLILPGSHRSNNNPTGENGVDPMESLSGETQATGPAGSVLVMDSRLWHATAPNRSDDPRVAVVVRYAPWWLNLEVLMPGSDERARMVEETGLADNVVPPLSRAVLEAMPPKAQPLFRHWVREMDG